jgi:hypothetical protein
MTKQQKKKLKKKIKKTIQANNPNESSDEDSDASPKKKQAPVPSHLRNLQVAMESELDRPRGASLPNMGFNSDTEEYKYVFERDFGTEIQQYFI